MKTMAWRIYGRDGHRQRESFGSCLDFTRESDGTRVQLLTSEKTGTNEYVILVVTARTAEMCCEELEGQLSDGVFENSFCGNVEEISEMEDIQI